MSLGGTSFGNKPIVADPLTSGVIAIFAEPSTPPRSSTIVIVESKCSRLPRRRRGSADLAALEGSILRDLLQSADEPFDL
jgi:hypothetical protein